jgi:hypothetical protein
VTTSEQARADAWADAETLRMALPPFLDWHIMNNSLSAYDFMRNPNPEAFAHVATYATWAARAAFRAVPGLRGE